ncbi:MAG: threonine--tRNA ligase [Kistimonas sp.]|nr:threonine--tRNA ligase [Kistimonas sp.]
MPVITLPDGSQREFCEPVSVLDVAESIGAGLAKACLAGRVDGVLVDADFVINTDVGLSVVTAGDPEGLEVIRHSTAHLLAMATQDLFPQAQVTIGPVIEDGFYYDFAYERGFNTDDLARIEQRMQELARQNLTVKRQLMSRAQALETFDALGESYKVEIIRELPEGEDISVYKQGDWQDLCRGPHVPSTGRLRFFKLMRVAGAYWRGDASNTMLTRIYGTAWSDKKSLQAYLERLQEAEKRDHRKLGKRLDLFHFQEEAPGMVFWHPAGWSLYSTLQQYMRNKQTAYGYQEIRTPALVDLSLWEKSGHAEKFGDDMFTLDSGGKAMALKPMNCPCHVQVFRQGLRSYKDLPLRLAEFGSCHRNEASGALHGLMRVRGFVQDDAHIFVTEEQIQSEVIRFIDFLHEVYDDFGFERQSLMYKLSTRPDQRVGSDSMWDKSEKALALALDTLELPWQELPGEGAFYGPKVEFSLKDSIGRVWQCGTVQVDFCMPGRLGAEYVDAQGERQTPVMLHRAILGSFERFIGILIEHCEGRFPAWLAPVQVVVASIAERQSAYVQEQVNKLQLAGFRVQADLRNEKIGLKIRQRTLERVPWILVAGDKEVQTGTLAVRERSGEKLGSMTLEAFQRLLEADIARFSRQWNPVDFLGTSE